MPPIPRSLAPVLGLAAVLGLAVVAPMTAPAPADPVAAAPEVPLGDATGGSAAVAAMRAGSSALPAASASLPRPVPRDARWAPERSRTGTEWNASRRMAIAQQALLAGGLGRLQGDALQAVVAVLGRDQASGHGAVETTPLINAVADGTEARPSSVPGDVRWAPERASAPAPSGDARGEAAAQPGVLSADRGSRRAGGLPAAVAALNDHGAPRARDTRAEPAVLRTGRHDEAAPATGDDRIADAPSGAD